jgi:putative ATP-dependent endonuclease of the OLD family
MHGIFHSDRTLFADGSLQEGRHYQCAFFGGALLARVQAVAPEEEVDELVNLIRVNPNIIFVCDSDLNDAESEGSSIKARVERIKAEVGRVPRGHCWITEVKEIENYLPGSILAKVYNTDNM